MQSNTVELSHQKASQICGQLNTDRILRRCKRFLTPYLPVDNITMDIFDPHGNRLINISRTSEEPPLFPGKSVAVSASLAEYLNTFVRRMGHVTICNTPEDSPELHHWWRSLDKPDASSMGMPLGMDGNSIVFLSILARGQNRFNPRHAKLFSMLHPPFSLALKSIFEQRQFMENPANLPQGPAPCLPVVHGTAKIIGEHHGLKEVMTLAAKVAPLSSQVLLLGETGVGKEVIANYIHRQSPRAQAPFIKVNCGAIPESLIDSELFGHEKGAFTGANRQKKGKFELAQGGTLFLDEIGELPPQAQVRLLRVLQTHDVERVGGSKSIRVDIRIIAATHRNLEEMVARGEFRKDLWFRINVVPLAIPPLRERTQDIPELIRYFMGRKALDLGMDYVPEPAPELLENFRQRPWEGNIRELENTIERMMILHLGNPRNMPLTWEDMTVPMVRPQGGKAPVAEPDGFPSLDEVVAEHIRTVLRHTRGRVQGKNGAAKILKMHPSTLRYRMKKLGIPYGRDKDALH